jgi:hypothetical protein
VSVPGTQTKKAQRTRSPDVFTTWSGGVPIDEFIKISYVAVCVESDHVTDLGMAPAVKLDSRRVWPLRYDHVMLTLSDWARPGQLLAGIL